MLESVSSLSHESFYTICGDSDPKRASATGFDWIKSYYIGAVSEIERKRIPARGVSIDRRTMALASPDYNSKNK